MVQAQKYENTDLKNTAEKAKRYQDAILIIQEYETIIQRQKRNMLSLAYSQGFIFKHIQDSIDFLDMVKELRISRLTTNFKINLIKLSASYF